MYSRPIVVDSDIRCPAANVDQHRTVFPLVGSQYRVGGGDRLDNHRRDADASIGYGIMEFGDFRNRAGDYVALDVKFTGVHTERVSHTMQPIEGIAARDHMQQLAIVGQIEFAGCSPGRRLSLVAPCDKKEPGGPPDFDSGEPASDDQDC